LLNSFPFFRLSTFSQLIKFCVFFPIILLIFAAFIFILINKPPSGTFSAVSPAKVLSVLPNPDQKSAMVIVPDNQLSLAIGKEGQNARLAAKLTGWKIDIKSLSQAQFLQSTELNTVQGDGDDL
jgi:hypothetical protein